MSGLELSDFEAFKKTPEAKAPPLPGAGEYIERQKAIIAANEAAGYYESSPEADWENAQGEASYIPLDEEDFDRYDRLAERQQMAEEMASEESPLAPSFSRKDEAKEQTRAMLSEQEWEDTYGLGYNDGYEDGQKRGLESAAVRISEVNEQLGLAQLEVLRLRKLLGR